jgi:hypothetical protein
MNPLVSSRTRARSLRLPGTSLYRKETEAPSAEFSEQVEPQYHMIRCLDSGHGYIYPSSDQPELQPPAWNCCRHRANHNGSAKVARTRPLRRPWQHVTI